MSVFQYTKRFLGEVSERAYKTARALAQSESFLGQLPSIFFLHVPKCGGTSVSEAFRGHMRTLAYQDLTRFRTLQPEVSTTAAQRFGMPSREYQAALLHYFLSDGRAKFVSGHFVIDPTIVEEYADEWGFVTLLRDPVARWLSFYFYNRYKNWERARINTSIEEFIQTNRAQALGQDYVDWLTARRAFEEGKPFSAPSRYRVEAAKEVIDQFDVVGTLENLSKFEAHVQTELGWPLRIGHENKNPVSKEKRDRQVSDRVIEKIEELCAPNREIYEYAR